MDVPAGLAWWRTVQGGAEWLSALPGLAAACAERWDLRLGRPFEPATISLVVPAERRDGSRVVLKINFPEAESEHEAAAMAHWNGNGAARLLEADPERAALLIERLDPARRLWSLPDAGGQHGRGGRAAAAVVGAARPDRPLRPPRGGRRRLGRRGSSAPAGPAALLDLAAGLSRDLLARPGEPVVLHQDFHGGNVLLDATRGWLAIDPKPLVGERAFDCASLVRDRRTELMRDPHPLARIRRRLDQLAEELALDRERIRGWGVVHAVAWGGEGGPGWDPAMVACAGWLADA